MMTAQEFAKKIRDKFPDGVTADGKKYSELSDIDLSKRVIEKHPVYKDQVQIGEKGLKGFGIGLGKSAGELLRGAGQMGQDILQGTVGRLVEKITGRSRQDLGTDIYDPESDLGAKVQEAFIAQSGAEKAGKTVGDIVQYLVPGGAAEKAAANSGKVAKVATRVLTDAGVTAVKEGEINKDTGVAGGISLLAPTTLRVAGKILKFPVNVGGRILKSLGSGLSGQKVSVLERLVNSKDPQAVLNVLKQQPEDIIAKNATQLRNEVRTLAKGAQEKFGQELDALPKRLGKAPQILTDKAQTTIKVGDKKYVLSTKGIKAAMTKALRDAEVAVDPKTGFIDFTTSPFVDSQARVLKNLQKLVNSWNDTTPKGIERLATKMRSFLSKSPDAGELNRVVGGMVRATRNYIGSRVPAAKTMIENYAKVMERIDVLDEAFGTNGTKVGGLLERFNTEKRLAQIFSGEKGTAIKELENLPGGKDLIEREAARKFAAGEITGSGVGLAISELLRGVSSSIITPVQVAELAVRLGQTKTLGNRFVEALSKVSPGIRPIAISFFLNLFPKDSSKSQDKQK